MVNVIATKEFEDWYINLSDENRTAVMRIVDLLELSGLSLGYPYSSEIKGAKYGAIRSVTPFEMATRFPEGRMKCGSRRIRVASSGLSGV